MDDIQPAQRIGGVVVQREGDDAVRQRQNAGGQLDGSRAGVKRSEVALQTSDRNRFGGRLTVTGTEETDGRVCGGA